MREKIELLPSLPQATAMAAGYNAIPVYLQLAIDSCEPLELFAMLKTMSSHCFLLESADGHNKRGRYTFIGFDPKAALSYANGKMELSNGLSLSMATSDPAAYIAQVLDEYRCPIIADLPPFTGGLVGYFAYDYIAIVEPSLCLTKNDAEGFKDIDLMLFDRLLAYDHLQKRLLLIATIKTNEIQKNYALAAHDLQALAELVVAANGSSQHYERLKLQSDLSELFSQSDYIKMVQKAKHYIRAGDVFQVVLSNRMSAHATGSLLDTYRILRKNNPSPYQFYFASADIELAGASPETLVRLIDGRVQTFPLAGTRPRSEDEDVDNRLGRELLADAKELAEHNMLVDLGRNDIGKVSSFGSVKVDNYLELLRFSHVMHIGSTVSGSLAKDKSAMDVIAAMLPAGTLSGAPKIRACQIIDELEDNRRGIYGGAIGYLAFNGNLDTCIAIRLVFMKQKRIFVRSGAGIVADSDPKSEYRECQAKMAAVLEAIKEATL
ncbi:MAG: anthranilate synthase component I family protein [Coriobacteriales bacterium]|jgi:anthranilate synthase component 1|nr:anthranilate synthase component I family protein [Coriobacteriales bacterium]